MRKVSYYLVGLMMFTCFTYPSYGQNIHLDLRDLELGRAPIEQFYFSTIGPLTFLDNRNSLRIEVDKLPTIVTLGMREKRGRLAPIRIFWVDSTRIKLSGNITQPKKIEVFPIRPEQEIVDQLVPTLFKNKEVSGELANTKAYYLHLIDKLGSQKTKHIREVMATSPEDLEGFWGTQYLKNYLSDIDNTGYSLKTGQIQFINGLNTKGDSVQYNFKGEKYTLLEFSSSGCGPCLSGIDRLAEIYEAYGDKLEIVMIWDDMDFNGWINIAKKQKDKITWVSLLDETRANFKVFDIKVYPTYALIDKNGYIIKEVYGKGLGKIEEFLRTNL